MANKLDRVKNGLSNVSNVSNRVSPAFLPQQAPQSTASLMSPILPVPVVPTANFIESAIQPTIPTKKGRATKKKKEDTSSKTPVSDQTTNAGGVVVKNRFKHSRPVLVSQNTPDMKRQKTGLDLIASNYNTVPMDTGMNDSDGQEIPLSQRYAVGCVPNSIYATVPGSQLLTASPSYSAVEIPQQPNMPICAMPICPSCRSTESCIPGPDFFQCMKCSQQFAPVSSAPKRNDNIPNSSANNVRSFYSLAPGLAHLAQSNVNIPLQAHQQLQQQQQQPAPPKRRAASKTSTKKKKQTTETIDLISDSDGEGDDDAEGTNNNENGTSSTNSTATTSKIADRMKLPGGLLPPTSTNNNQNVKNPIPNSQYRATTPTPPPNPSPSPSPAPTDNTPTEYKFNCHKAMFGELYGETLAPTRCADNRVYLSLQCQMYRESVPIPEKYTLSVGQNDVQQILVYFGRVPSFVAIETSTRFAEVACRRIGKEVLVPGSHDAKKRYIILALQSAFKIDTEASVELTHLVACLTPWARLNILTLEAATKLISEAHLDVNQKEICFNRKAKIDGPAETLLIYQQGCKSGGIPVTTEDVACLAEGTYLNDIIIDFYLKYVFESILTPAQREKTYIFNSYFYKRLTQKQGTKFSPDQMHGLVKKWTRNVDIFEKDFIVIPVNEHCHWYLVVICFPGGTFIAEEDLSEKEEEEEEDESADFIKESKSEEGNETKPATSSTGETLTTTSSEAAINLNAVSLTNTTNTIVLNTTTLTQTPNTNALKVSPPTVSPPTQNTSVAAVVNSTPTGNDLADAVTTSENLAAKNSDGTPTDPANQNEGASTTSSADGKDLLPTPPVKEKVVYKQACDADAFTRPCILIFDSLVGSGHSRVFTNLRHYLTQEWALRKSNKSPRVFDKSNTKGCYPKIPRQNNDCDCGVFLLQYVESFFTRPIKSFRIPVHLESWFTLEHVSKKREHISDLISRLAAESKIKQEVKQEVKQEKNGS